MDNIFSKEVSKFDIECQMSLEEWIEGVENGFFDWDDGEGVYGTETHKSKVDSFDTPPSGTTHVYWYNK